ncbi:MAG TPA: alpha-L-fucosidase [Pseudonocardiaceae bacterium]|nr:alpha-L-fucosidase [Pseudonocardiaceae bacterium]
MMPPALTLAGVAVEPGRAATPYWLTSDRVSAASGYDTRTMLHSLIDQVSKGSNLLLNIVPMADGTIPCDQRSILLGMQDWLGRFGEAIQATRVWSTYGEGPTQMGGGLLAAPRAGTPQDIRFTRTQDNTVLYATTLGWQGGTTTITTLGANRINLGNLASVQLLDSTAGRYVNLTGHHQDGGLHITMPSLNPPFIALAYVFKLTFTGQIPVLGAPTAAERTTR